MKTKGFTILEMILVVAILGIVSAIAGLILYQSFRAGYTSEELLDVSWQGRLALQRISYELRDAVSFNSNSDGTTLRFYDLDGIQVYFTRRGGDYLQYRYGSGWRILADGVTAATFSYLDANNNTISTPLGSNINNVRCVNIDVTINKNNATLPLQTTVCPRNLLW